MASIAQEMRFPIDLRGGLMEQPQRGKLMCGDKNAAVVIAELYDGDKPYEGNDVTVTGKFSRKGDGIDIRLDGTMENGAAMVTLDEHCFAVAGRYELRVKLKKDGITRTVLFISGYVENDGEGGILDVENVIPSVDDIVDQYAEMKRVTRETEEARDRAIEASMQANFTVLDRFETYDELIAKHPTGEAGQAFAVGTVDDNVVYIWGIDTKSWVNIGPVQGAQGPTGATGDHGKDGISPSVTVEEIEGGHRVTITDANGAQSFDVMNGTNGDDGEDSIGANQELNTTSDVVFNSLNTTQPLNADQLGGKNASEYALKDEITPIATSDKLGCVKIGNGLSVDKNGVLSLASGSLNFKILRNITMTYFSVIGGYSSGVLDGITGDSVVIAGELIPGDNLSAYITHLQTSGNTVMMNAKNRDDNADCTLNTLTLNFILYV